MCCSVLQYVAVCCGVSWCVVVCRGVSWCVTDRFDDSQGIAMCCRMLRYVAVCCGVLAACDGQGCDSEGIVVCCSVCVPRGRVRVCVSLSPGHQ